MRKTVIERAALYLGNVGVCLRMGLEGMKREVGALVVAKGFYNSREDVPKKLLFAFIELGEAADA
jgi:hypothetical protein